MYAQTSLFDMLNVISSQESASGPTPSGKQDGQTDAPSGPAPALASLSARQAKALGLLTSGTYGPRSFISSASDDLTWCLASRLRARTASLGSTLYKLTWKVRATPSGRQIPALRATARRKSDSASTLWGWPAPRAEDAESSGIRHSRGVHDTLTAVAWLSGWPTAVARDWKNGKASQATHDRNARPLNEIAMLSGWPAPKAQEDGRTLEQYEAARLRGYEARKGKTSGGPSGKQGGIGDLGAVGDRLPGPTNGVWRDADWLYCRDGKWRPVDPGSFPLAHGAPARVGRLRGYGNAVVAEQAIAWAEEVMEEIAA